MSARAVLCIITLIFLLFFNVSAAICAIIHVKWDATGAGDGTCWTDAYTDLQASFPNQGKEFINEQTIERGFLDSMEAVFCWSRAADRLLLRK